MAVTEAPSNVQVLSDATFDKKLSQLRDFTISSQQTRQIVSELTSIIAETAIQQPEADEQVAVIVVLRSGMAMMESFVSKLPSRPGPVIYHLGLFRDRATLQPVEYYNKLAPRSPKIKHAYIIDPLVATGGTADASISILRDWGVPNITFTCILASQEGLNRLTALSEDGVKFVVGHVDNDLDQDGYIKPGIGDIGDRLYGTQLV